LSALNSATPAAPAPNSLNHHLMVFRGWRNGSAWLSYFCRIL
jgi:hypothetical protein